MKSVWINGKIHLPDQINSGSYPERDKNLFENKILRVIRDWERGTKTFLFKTSGSTGDPKSIAIDRERMRISALATMEFLHINSGSSLLCLDPGFIAGTMMIIRTLVRGMNLYAIQPTSNPFKDFPENIHIDLCAIVPLQLHEILQDESSRNKFSQISNVLIGGADLSDEMKKQIRQFPNPVYHTFGMTETVTHIALRRMSGNTPDEYFKAVPGVQLAIDERDCLVVNGKITGDLPFITNDRVELIDPAMFKWLGRIDHVINSGGVKIVVEPLEKKIESILKKHQCDLPFFIVGIPDKKFGQKIAIIFESVEKKINVNEMTEILKNKLKPYEMPKQWRFLPEFIKTSTRKIDRNQSLKISTEIH